MARTGFLLLLLLLLGAPALPVRAQEQAEHPCYDIAVVASLAKSTYAQLPEEPGYINMDVQWFHDVVVQQLLVGHEPRQHLQLMGVAHTGFNPRIEHFLFYLKRAKDRYEIVGMDYRIVEDKRGRLVLLLDQPTHSAGWFAPDPKLIKPVYYRPDDAWWLIEPKDVDPQPINPAWARRKERTVIALRGIVLDDLARSLRARPTDRCVQHDR